VTAYKFLLPGAVAPFSRFAWPVGEWVESAEQRPCRAGVHACRAADLPYWLHEELWELELGGEPLRLRHKLVAPRGRLIRRVEAWNDAAGKAFAEACVERVRLLAGRRDEAAGYLDDLERFAPHVRPAAVASLAARAAEAVEGPAAYEAERDAQAGWLIGELGLDPDP
jgi:hypothetical protein